MTPSGGLSQPSRPVWEPAEAEMLTGDFWTAAKLRGAAKGVLLDVGSGLAREPSHGLGVPSLQSPPHGFGLLERAWAFVNDPENKSRMKGDLIALNPPFVSVSLGRALSLKSDHPCPMCSG